MPTIAEIIAAKKAAAAGTSKPAPAAPSAPKETIGQRVELQQAIDRIDPPGKSERVAAARKSAGLILSKDMPAPANGEPRGQATPIAGPPEPRALAVTQGEVFDMTPTDAPPEEQAWHAALASVDTDLCVMRDPTDPEACWLALKSAGIQRRPLLLHRLPWLLWDHPAQPEGDPF